MTDAQPDSTPIFASATFTYETIRILDRNVDGFPFQARLTLGADGLLYGFAQTKGPKLNMMSYKNKTGYKRRMGHRQKLTQVRVTAIEKG